MRLERAAKLRYIQQVPNQDKNHLQATRINETSMLDRTGIMDDSRIGLQKVVMNQTSSSIDFQSNPGKSYNNEFDVPYGVDINEKFKNRD